MAILTLVTDKWVHEKLPTYNIFPIDLFYIFNFSTLIY